MDICYECFYYDPKIYYCYCWLRSLPEAKKICSSYIDKFTTKQSKSKIRGEDNMKTKVNNLYTDNYHFGKQCGESVTSSTTVSNSSTYCKYRLPCGWCDLRKCHCTLWTTTYTAFNSSEIPCTLTASNEVKQ